ncbi:MAG: ABC transporter permease [Actinobacteria bacterium]|nr:ABC transporter permease [Actinomycetota bacterium]
MLRFKTLTGAKKIYAIVFAVVFVLSLIRLITGASDLTSIGTAEAALLLSVPIVLAGLGGLFSERSGVVNIGLEGMMIMGAWGGGFFGSKFGPWAGFLGAIFCGMVGALLHALATITFGVDHVVSGVAINIIAAGLARYLSTILAHGGSWPGPSQSPDVDPLPLNGLPILSGGHVFGWHSPDLLTKLADKNWFLISDFASILRGITGDLGVNIYAMKYAGVIISGAFAGLGGGFLAIVAANHYQENQVGGRGYIGLAAMLFGNYRPGGLLAGAGLFGFSDALQLRDAAAIHALLILVIVFLLFGAFRNFQKTRIVQAVIGLSVAGFIGWFYTAYSELPGQLVTMTPYIATVLVLSLSSQRLRGPAADGIPYRRGGAT